MFLKNISQITKHSAIQYILLLVALAGYSIGDRRQPFSNSEFLWSVYLTLFATFCYFKVKKKKNYFDFDTIFIFTSLMIGFFATFFYDAIFYKSLFSIEFNYSYINSGSWVFCIGMISYFCGSISLIKMPNRKVTYDRSFRTKIYNCDAVFLFQFIVIALFIGTGGFSYYKSMYTNGSQEIGLASHFSIIIVTCSFIIVSCEFSNKRNFRNYMIRYWNLIPTVLFAVLIMVSGNRTIGLQLLISMFGLYTFFFLKIKLKYFAPLLLVGFVSMYAIQLMRSDKAVEYNVQSPALMAIDLTIPYRTTFVAMDYVDQYDYSYGLSMTAPLIGAIPGLSRLLPIDLRKTGSAELLTDYTFRGSDWSFGLGTNVIGDIYLSFGLIGIIALMFMLGYFVSYTENRALQGNIIWIIVLAGLLGDSVFLARASYTHPVRPVVWAVVIFLILRNLKLIRCTSVKKNSIKQ